VGGKRYSFLIIAAFLSVFGFLWGGLLFGWLLFFAGLAAAAIVAVVGNAFVGAYLLWKLHEVVKQDVSTPDNAFQTATQWWLLSYVTLSLCMIPGFWLPRANLLHWITQKIGLIQFPLIMGLTFPVALLAFYLKRETSRTR
jgi:hypothetical protein